MTSLTKGDDLVPKFKRGDRVNFKGMGNLKPVKGTYVWAVLTHLAVMYLIEHVDGEITKQGLKMNNGFEDGFESIHSSMVQEGHNYILVVGDSLELAPIKNKTIL